MKNLSKNILQKLQKVFLNNGHHPIIIGISGVSGSGKTVIAKELSTKLKATSIHWDDYEEISEFPSDYIKWFHKGKDFTKWKTPALAKTLLTLKAGVDIQCPAINKLLRATPFIIFDAPLGYDHEETGQFIDFLVQLEVPLDISLVRRLMRDYLRKDVIETKDLREELQKYCDYSRPLFLIKLKHDPDIVVDGTLSKSDILDKIIISVYETIFNNKDT